MSKKDTDTKLSDNHVPKKVDFKGKTNEELKDIAQTLEAQLQKYQTMAIKAQGALEVVLQMISEEEVDES